MIVTNTTQTQYTTSSKTSQSQQQNINVDDVKVDTLDDKANEILNQLLVGMSDKDKGAIKLSLSFNMSIKSESMVNGELHIEREYKTDTQSILDKLGQIANNPDNDGYLSDEIRRISSELIKQYAKATTSANFINQEDLVVDEFLQDLYSKDSSGFKSALVKDEIKNKVDEYAQMMMETNGDVPESELEASKLLSQYKNKLLQEYKESIENSQNTVMNAEQEAIIKILLDENEKESSSLEALLAASTSETKETRTPEEIIAEYRTMLEVEVHEGMFEEQKAAALARHEPYFQKEYEYYEKYKDIFTPIYSNYTTEKANKIAKELNAQFPEYKAMREKASRGGTEQDKEAFEDMFMDYQAYNKYLREKYDMDMSMGSFMAATKESSKAYNYAVYDALESGMSIEEATSKARSLLSTFGGREAQSFAYMFFSGYPEDIEAAIEIPEEEIDYDKQIDLRDYGFEHNFWTDAYLNNFEDDSQGIKARIMYDIKLYSFLLENDALVNTRLDELKERAYQTDQGKDWYDWQNEDGKFNEEFKSSFQDKYDNAVYARDIYDKYADKIFDNSLLDDMDKSI